MRGDLLPSVAEHTLLQGFRHGKRFRTSVTAFRDQGLAVDENTQLPVLASHQERASRPVSKGGVPVHCTGVLGRLLTVSSRENGDN